MSKKKTQAIRTAKAARILIKSFIENTGYSIYDAVERSRSVLYATKDEVTGAAVAFQADLNKQGVITGLTYTNIGLSLEDRRDDLFISVGIYNAGTFLTELAPIINTRPVVTPSNMQDFAYTIDGLAGTSYGLYSTRIVTGGGAYEAYA